jgi:hypothetical protein
VETSEALRRLGTLPEGWDGDQGASIKKETIFRAWRLIENVFRAGDEFGITVPKPAVHAGGDGSVGFSWRHPSKKADFEIHVPENLDENIYFLTYKMADAGLRDASESPDLEALALLKKLILTD